MFYESLVLSAPALIGVGILLQDDAWSVVLALAALALPSVILRYFTGVVLPIFMAICISAGVGALYFWDHDYYKIDRQQYFREITGTVERIRHFPRFTQITLGKISRQNKINNIRLSSSYYAKYKDIDAGDIVTIEKVYVEPIPLPTAINGYDFGQTAYLQKLSAIGTFRGKVTVIKASNMKAMPAIRRRLFKYMQDNLRPENASLLISIALGDKSLLSDAQAKAMRNSGLAHMMAVSGFHMSILGGIILFTGQLLQIALRFNHYLIYLFTALICFFYLLIVEIPISAERAYIMLALFLAALASGRLPSGKYNLALAASAILLSSPGSLFSPSFQMSFAATLAIVVLLDSGNRYKFRHNFVISTVYSSLAATLATLPFCAYHFKNFAMLGVITNVLVAPIIAFVTTPCFLMSIALPINLMRIVDLSLGTTIKLATWVASLPMAIVHIPQIPFSSVIMLSVSIIFFSGTNKTAVLPALFIGIAMVMAYHQPDVFIGLDNKNKLQIAYKKDNHLVTDNHKNFINKEWALQIGDGHIKKIEGFEPKIRVIPDRDLGIRIIYDEKDTHYIGCEALKGLGTHQVWETNEGLIVKHATQTKRPWRRVY